MTDRNEPLRLMDEIERSEDDVALVIRGYGLNAVTLWQALRTALEAQAEELAQVREWNRQMVEKAASGGTLDGYREMGQKLAQAHARIARLEGFLREKRLRFKGGMGSPHLPELDALLNEHPRQSAAALKAEALREFAERARQGDIQTPTARMNLNIVEMAAAIEADRIEREAKEASDERS